MRKILIAVITIMMLVTTVNAAEIGISSDKGIGKIQTVKIDDEVVRIDVTVQLFEDKKAIKYEYVTFAMYGPTQPEGLSSQKVIDGKTYYSYYIDQVRTDANGKVDFSFNVSIPNEEKCYLIFSGYKVDVPFELEVLLPPADSQVIDPMDKPKPVGGGSGGGGGGGNLDAAFPAYKPKTTPAVDTDKSDIDFSDMDSAHWAYNDCVKLYNLGIVTGDGDGSLRPADNISREEIAVVLAKAFKLDISAADIKVDTTTSDWAKSYIAAAVKNGVMMDDANGTYRGTSFATRAEVVAMVNRCAKLSGSADKINAFSDYSEIPDYSIEGFCALIEKGIINGYEDNTVRPNNYITRAELFKIISRIVEEG